MTQFYYIGSPVPLPLGERGSVPSKRTYSEVIASPEYIAKQEELRAQGMVPLSDIVDLSHIRNEDSLLFDTEEDAAGIYLAEVHYLNAPVTKQFRNPYVYAVSASWGSFEVKPEHAELYPESHKASLKCCRELFKVMKEFAPAGDVEYELYACWADEEEFPRRRKLDRIIRLADFDPEREGFQLEEKQYIVVKL